MPVGSLRPDRRETPPMTVPRRGRRLLPLLALVAVLAPAAPAQAHDRIAVGPLVLTIGWEHEPPITGVENAVSVAISTSDGKPVRRVDRPLSVEVSFGDERVGLPLLPAPGIGHYRATIIPTRAGTYAFRINGRVMGRRVEVASICSKRTFDCVIDAAEQQFPKADPSAGELDARISRLSARVERANDRARRANRVAFVSAAVAILALVAVLAAVVLRSRKRRTVA